jgi:hypothetical protein
MHYLGSVMTINDEPLPCPLGDDWLTWDPFDIHNYPFGRDSSYSEEPLSATVCEPCASSQLKRAVALAEQRK